MISGYRPHTQVLDGGCRDCLSIRSIVTSCLSAASLVLASIGAPATAQTAGQNITREMQSQISVPLPSLAPLVERVSPAVVNISVVLSDNEIAQNEQQDEAPGAGPSPFDDFLRKFFEQQAMPGGADRQRPRPRAGQAVALGSGFIIDPNGSIVTNNHVVGNADKVTVVFQDNSKHPARIVGRDDKTDIALVKIDTDKPLPFVAWGDSDAAKVGDWVVAVGNPFGLGGTVTSGIISALGRNIDAGPYDDFLQIDASINRGNSGGPTFNLSGQVIGINTAIYSPSGGSVGIGFAVPSNLAKNIVAQLNQNGRVSRGWLGVQIQRISPEIAKGLGLPTDNPKGALVASVVPDSPAAKAGVKEGDVIVRFAGKEVKDAHDLPRLVAETPIGQKVDLTVLRNGKEQPLQTNIAELPAAKSAVSGSSRREPTRPRKSSALGMQLSELGDDARKQTGASEGITGVVVVAVASDSPAAGLVEPGDVIVSINQQAVDDPVRAADKLKEAAAKKQVLLLVNHQGNNRFVGLPLSAGRG